MRFTRTLSAVTVTGALALVLTGCFGGPSAPADPGAADPGDTQNSETKAPEAPAETGSEGTEDGFETVAWPADWPAEVPRLNGPVVSANAAEGANPHAVIVLVEDGEIDGLITQLESSGFETTFDQDVGGYMLTLQNSNFQVDLISDFHQPSGRNALRYYAMPRA